MYQLVVLWSETEYRPCRSLKDSEKQFPQLLFNHPTNDLFVINLLQIHVGIKDAVGSRMKGMLLKA